MADLLAREAMKELDRKITGIPNKERSSFAALRDSKHFVFVERDRGYCTEWRSQLDRMMDENGGSREGFKEWLESNRRSR